LGNKRPCLTNHRRVIFHWDKAQTHTAGITSAYLEEFSLEKMIHPHSPDFAPEEYHLFHSLQHHYESNIFHSRNNVYQEVQVFLIENIKIFSGMVLQRLLQSREMS